MFRDFVYAARSLRSRPAFTAAAVLTLALGIGASTAMFSVANGVLVRPLPYKNPGRLVYVCADLPRRSVSDNLWSATDYLDLRDMARSALADAAALSTFRASLLRDDGTPEDTAFANVTPNIFRVLGLRVVLGRDFADTDGLPQPATADGAPPPPAQRLPVYAIVSYEYFQRHFGGNPAVLGKPLLANGPILIGVVERGAELLFRPDKNIERQPDIWMALRLSNTGPRVTLAWRVIARLRDGVSIERAQSQADVVAAHSRSLEPAYRGANLQFRVEPMQRYLVAPVRPAILALMGAVIFLLLIACSNVANLFLVRASLRARDLAVRTAMGASWWRLARQALAEALLVAGAGSAFGFGLAWAGMRELLAIAPGNLPRLDAARLDPSVLAFSIALGVVSAVLFGLAPALRAANPDVAQVLRAAGRTSGLGAGALLRNAVVVAEVALCFVLLVGSALMLRSFLALQQIDPGFDPHHVLTFRAQIGRILGQARTSDERAAIVRKIQAALAAIPGVESVTAASLMPLSGPFFPYRWGLEDAVADESKFRAADTQIVLPGYFEAMHTPIVAGRSFNESDNNPQTAHVIIDQEMAAKAFPHLNPVGQRILMRFRITPPEWYEVIGVVAHQRLTSLADPGREQAYMTDGYFDHVRMQDWALRVHGDPASYIAPVRAAMTKFNRGMLLTHLEPMEAIVERAEAGTRFSLMLIASFAGIAALLAAVGLYGVLATVVRQRTAEIGVRMAMGAAPSGIFAMMIASGLRLSAIGIGLGMAAALLLTRVMTSMLVGIRPNDPATFAAMAALFFLIAALASWLPARRAAALDPSAALREE